MTSTKTREVIEMVLISIAFLSLLFVGFIGATLQESEKLTPVTDQEVMSKGLHQTILIRNNI